MIYIGISKRIALFFQRCTFARMLKGKVSENQLYEIIFYFLELWAVAILSSILNAKSIFRE